MLGGFYRCGRKEKSLVGLLPLHLTHAGHTGNPTVHVQILSCRSLLCSGRLLWRLAGHCGVAQFLVSQIFRDSQGLAGSATSGCDFLTNCRGTFWSALVWLPPTSRSGGHSQMKSGQLCPGPGSIQCRRVVIPQGAGGGNLRWASGVAFLKVT